MSVPVAIVVHDDEPAESSDVRNTSLDSTTLSHRQVIHPSNNVVPSSSQPPQKRLYRVANNRWVTRDIAALDFLLNIPLAAEASIVQNGYLQQSKQQEDYESNSDDDDNNEHKEDDIENQRRKESTLSSASAIPAVDPQGRWWEKWISSSLMHNQTTRSRSQSMGVDAHLFLEGPTRQDKQSILANSSLMASAPGRRLEGDEAIRIQIPLTVVGGGSHPSAGNNSKISGSLTNKVSLTSSSSSNSTNMLTKQRSIARVAALREWERQTAHGIPKTPTAVPQPPLLDGRLFFSASGSYPVSVYSMIRYEPKREEAQLRRLKLEARGGGGSQFRIPARDWRGISYRSLLPRARRVDSDKYAKRTASSSDGQEIRAFNRFLKETRERDSDYDAGKVPSRSESKDMDYDDDESSLSSDDSNEYVPGILDDPDMVLGRHRNVMMGDRVIGPIIASTIQFVEPALLKADLNKQFRERFDGWEPSKSALKYIGAKVVNGNYILTEPVIDDDEDEPIEEKPLSPLPKNKRRQSSTTSSSAASEISKEHPQSMEKQATEKQMRMPPSLTLSKVRSLKHQALQVALKANFEIGTLSLACVYFERLCLDCRVDKSNRRLTFAACLLLASKLNEPNVGLVMQNTSSNPNNGNGEGIVNRFSSFARPNNRSNTMFAALLEFFTQEWELTLKNLFDCEWGVFAALGFSLHAKPSQVAFHFKRFMKTMEWSPKTYLGAEMFGYWQEALVEEEDRRLVRERRKARLQHRKEEELLNLHIEIENDLLRRNHRSESDSEDDDDKHDAAVRAGDDAVDPNTSLAPPSQSNTLFRRSMSPHRDVSRKSSGITLLQRFGMRRIASTDRLVQEPSDGARRSLPLFATPSAASSSDTASATVDTPSFPSQPPILHQAGISGLSDTAEAAMDLQVLDLEAGLLHDTLSVDSVAGSDKDKSSTHPV
jgi:hypothetical protein